MPTKDKTGIIFTTLSEKPFRGASNSRPGKSRKMISPRCDVHYTGLNGQRMSDVDWAECEAEGHDPYFTAKGVPHTRQLTETREDGRVYITGEETEIEYVRTPNWEAVPDELGIYSGRGVVNSLERGYKFPEDLGYAPFCDYLGCGEQNPKFRTRFGNYHSRTEAALMALKTDLNDQNEGTAVFTEVDANSLSRQMREKAAEEGF